MIFLKLRIIGVVAIFVYLLSGCNSTKIDEKKSFLENNKHDISVDGYSSTVGAESETNNDIQIVTYWLDITNHDNVEKVLKSVEPELNEIFAKKIIGKIDSIELNKPLKPSESTKVEIKIQFNAKGMSKEQIMVLEPYIKNLKIVTEKKLALNNL